MKYQTIIVNQDDNGIRLDRWFKRHYPNTPFGIIAKLVRKKDIRLNDKRADIADKISTGDKLSFPMLKEYDDEPTQKRTNDISDDDIKMILDSVIYKDDYIIVINKPTGLAVQGGSKIKISVDVLAEHLKFEYDEKPKLVHRLDKETSGLLVLARKSNVAADLSRVIQGKHFDKTYLAICVGVPKVLSGKIDTPIEKLEDAETKFEKVKPSQTGKKAVTFYQVLDRAEKQYSLIQADIITGRTHQIRVHLSSIGCPILGDEKYGQRSEVSRVVEDKLYLHAYKLGFTLYAKKYSFDAEFPPHFKEALNDLGLSVNN